MSSYTRPSRNNLRSNVLSVNKSRIVIYLPMRRVFFLSFFGFATAVASSTQSQPNILWLTIEDTSAYAFGCYGNPDAKTPNIDRLAREGIQFTRAWSNGVQCSPSRSTLISGCYAPTFGTDYHRADRPVPVDLFGFPRDLKNAGYFTSNNAKTDYNASNFDTAAVWTLSSSAATYNHAARAPGQPFFSVFNASLTHMSRLTTVTIEGRRDFSKVGLSPAKLTLPPHVPDLPEIRSDYAFHLEGVQDVDKWVGLFLADLATRGLAEDTIIFFFSDHGGCLPRGKGFVFDTGLHIPLIVYFPPKWRHLAAGFEPGVPSDRLVSFVDFAPTLLSLAGIEPPASLQGQPLFGPYAANVKPRDYNFGFTANREDNYSPARALTDGTFLYLRNYRPRRPLALRNFFQWGMPANLAWDTAFLDGKLMLPEHRAPFGLTPTEQLFDLSRDPYNIVNLAADPAHAAIRARLSEQLDTVLAQTSDLGFFPPRDRDRGLEDLHSWVRRTEYSVARLQAAALRAATARLEDLPVFEQDLTAPEPELRYWAANGLAELAVRGQLAAPPVALVKAARDPDDEVASVANEVLFYLGRATAAVPQLLALLRQKSDEAHVALETISLLPDFRERLKPFIPDLEKIAAGEKNRANKPATSVLANLGLFPPAEIYANALKKGLRDNAHSRPLIPTPAGKPGMASGGDNESD